MIVPVEVTASGPLHVHPGNGRCFADGTGRAVYLTGSHTWANLQDFHVAGERPFDFAAYLDFLQQHNHNFIRLWAIEHAGEQKATGERVIVDPLPYARTGPGLALDGKQKFDLTRYDESYFERLRRRVRLAGERGIYVSVMLFLWYSVGVSDKDGDRWRFHPFHRDNNANGIDGDLDSDGTGNATHTLRNKTITELQEGYVRRVVEAVFDLPNVLYEIANESLIASRDWQYHMIDFIRRCEAGKAVQHPIGMTAHMNVGVRHGPFSDLVDGPADWISPAMGDGGGNWCEDPPVADGRKVILVDSDHLWGIGGDRRWVWKSFCRGLNPIFMDPWQPWPAISALWQEVNRRDYPAWEPVRNAMGQTRRFADRLDLAHTVPSTTHASTRYALVHEGRATLVYQPTAGTPFLVRLQSGRYYVEWFDPASSETHDQGLVEIDGSSHAFTPPFADDSVLLLLKERL